MVPTPKSLKPKPETRHHYQEYIVSPPTCVGGMCVDIFAEGLCNCRVPIYVYPGDATSLNKDNKIGGMVKIWSGLGAELFTDADKFEVSLLIWDYGLGLGSGPSSWQTLTGGRRVSRFLEKLGNFVDSMPMQRCALH